MNKKLKLFAIIFLSLMFTGSMLVWAVADSGSPDNDVILAEESFEIDFSNASDWWGLGAVSQTAPEAGSGSSVSINLATNTFWKVGYIHRGDGAKNFYPIEELGVEYTQKSAATASDGKSDLGVAVWVWIGNEDTLAAMADAKLQMRIGDHITNTSNYWITGATPLSTLDLKVGWNEIVIKHNPNYTTGGANPDLNDGIVCVYFEFTDFTAATKDIKLNDVRLVKTSQTTNFVLNRQEALYGDDDKDFVGTEGYGVITYEMPFDTFSSSNMWGGGSGIADIAPKAGKGMSITRFGNTLGYWMPTKELNEGINVEKALNINYDAASNTSDLGVAFWLYIHDEATLTALKNDKAVMGVRFGLNASNRWMTAGEGSSAGKFSNFDLKVGWNEVVMRQINWKSGNPDITDIRYMNINIANMDVGTSIAINDVRLVKTTQTTDVTINRQEETEVEEPADGVIVKQMPYGEITEDNYSAWGGTYSATSSVKPFAGQGMTLSYFNNPDVWWTTTMSLATPVKPIEELGVKYDGGTKLTDLGVAFWLYVGDEETLEAMKVGRIGIFIGPSNTKYWITGGAGSNEGIISNLELSVGWNELVIKQNAAWTSGAPGDLDEIAYLSIRITDMSTSGTKLALNDIRLVKTTQGCGVIVNKYEPIGYNEDELSEFMSTEGSGLADYYPAGSELSDNVPEGCTGKSVKLPASDAASKTFATPIDLSNVAWKDDEGTVIAFRLYISNITEFKSKMEYSKTEQDAFVMFTDSSRRTIYASLKDQYMYLNEGWNRIMIKVADSGFDLGAITGFAIANDINISESMYVYGFALSTANYVQDDYMINNAAYGDGYWNKLHDQVIAVPDGTEGWENVGEVKTVGTGLLKMQAAVAATPAEYFTYTAYDLDISGWNAQFITMTFWLYTGNPAVFNSRVNHVYVAENKDAFTSGNYYAFSLAELNFVKGWNNVRLKFDDSLMEGTVDATKISYFYFDITSDDNNMVAVSELRLYESSVMDLIVLVNRFVDVSEEAPDPEHKVVFDATDNIDKWDQNAFGVMPYGAEEGQKSIYLTSESGVLQARLRTSAVDISAFNFNHTVLTFWMYVNDISLMGALDAQIELGNGFTEDDSNEFGWEFRSISLRGFESNKWHKIALRIIPNGLDKSNEKGVVDLTALRFFRMYWIGEGGDKDVQVLLSNITIEEMDTSSFYEVVTVLEKRDFTQGTTPGEIDEYDMIESADGTFPQERPGTTHPDDSTGTVDSGSIGNGGETQTASCGGCSGAGLGQAAVLALIVIPCSALLLKRRRE